MAPTRLPRSFYLDDDVVGIARSLLGKVLVTEFNGMLTSGIINETEAYAGITDRASHAYGGRRTERTEVMYAQGGTAYVYLCYGIHHLFNVVTGAQGQPHAVLVRGIIPLEGMAHMHQRRKGRKLRTDGPGLVGRVLGLHTGHSGLDLCNGPVLLEDHGTRVRARDIATGPRVGVDYAGHDAQLPYRFRWLSMRP